ncbi:MAG: spondin domain-containing protein [Myxococcales bacterium]|nr:spondin domain-containing protein [Myxococcales bacterium]
MLLASAVALSACDDGGDDAGADAAAQDAAPAADMRPPAEDMRPPAPDMRAPAEDAAPTIDEGVADAGPDAGEAGDASPDGGPSDDAALDAGVDPDAAPLDGAVVDPDAALPDAQPDDMGVEPGDMGPPPGPRRYVVTIQNLSKQPLGPVVAATHPADLHLWRPGGLASPGIRTIAEMGVPFTFYDEVAATEGVTQVINAGVPMTPRGTTRDSFGPFPPGVTLTDHVSFVIEGDPGDTLSLASMVVITNDGFWGLDGVELPADGTRAYLADAYDAGTEENTELAAHLDDGGSILGPVALPGDPNGNGRVATEPPERIAPHGGITGVGDLTVEDHGFDAHVARVLVTALPEGLEAYAVETQNLTSQPMGPSLGATHDADTHLWVAAG